MYPDKHKEIVTSLMEGKFITVEDFLFETIKKNEDFYINFFETSFGFEIIGNHDFYYLVSSETNEPPPISWRAMPTIGKDSW